MGGGGGGSRNFFRDITPKPKDEDCNKIYFITDLQNVQSCISDYRVDDILDVKLDILERVYVEGEHGICGYLTTVSVAQLINCLKKRKEFKATILSISGISCRVDVKPN